MNAITKTDPVAAAETELAIEVFAIIANDLLEDVDRPELWEVFPQFIATAPKLAEQAEAALRVYEGQPAVFQAALIILAMCKAHSGRIAEALGLMTPLLAVRSQSPLVTGATFFIHGLGEPENPKYKLKGKICTIPFERLEVLENTTHLCCASWLKPSAGNLHTAQSWRDVWNSPTASAIRASIHDGSYRYCDKMACPAIQSDQLVPATDLATRSDGWRELLQSSETHLERGPVQVNLAYDRTCNLSCPSCRTSKYAADDQTRQIYDRLQERAILPLLKEVKRVTITGSGDPFASKNFRRLIERLTAEQYPDLKFHIMTNAMLFTAREWERFPALHGRIELMSISLDGASADTHETLRRGARWDVMQRNLSFAGMLRRQGLIDELHLSFVVQAENYHEMGDAVDLAEKIGADRVYFGRITNWGTFSNDEYARKAVFLPEHPEHHLFLERMADPRLMRATALTGNLAEFLPGRC